MDIRFELPRTGFVSCFLALVLLFSASLFVLPSVETGQAEVAGEAAAESPAPPSAEELPGRRTATTNTYRLHSGLLETRIYGTPVNFEDQDGNWEPIEEGLEETDEGEITNGASSVEITLPSDLQEGPAQLSFGEEWIASELLGAETGDVELSEGMAAYESPKADASFEYTTLPNGLKEEIELEGPSSPSSFRFELTASPGLKAELAADGSIRFERGDGKAMASLPAPTVADAGSLAPNSDEVGYELERQSASSWVLTVAVNPAWLADPQRSWPVTVDPTMTAEGTDLDCVIGGKTGQEGWIDCADWGRDNLLAGYNAELKQAEDSWYRSLMYLRTAEIIPGADVVSASLELHASEAAQNTAGVAVHRVIKPWTWQANWKRYATGQSWESEGGDFAPEALGEVKTSLRGSGSGWWSVPIQAAKVAEAAAKKQSLSVIVKLIDDKTRQCSTTSCTDRLIKFDSSNAWTSLYKPYLRILYDFRSAPSTSKMTSPEEGRKSSHYFTLQSQWGAPPSNDPGVNGVTYQMKLPGWNEFRTIPAQFLQTAKGAAVSWPLPVTQNPGQAEPLYLDYPAACRAMEPNVSEPNEEDIKLRAVFAGGAYSKGASEPVTVEYSGDYGGVGAPTDATASVGPVSLDLLTGNYMLSQTDVSIPVPGSEANLEFTRTYESNYRGQSVPSLALGRGWQPSAPVEQEFEGQAWTSLVERHQDAVPPVYEKECWLESGQEQCEEWMAEEEIPAADWIEITDNEGGIVAFDLVNGAYVAPDYMKGWILAKKEETMILTGPEGVRTAFSKNLSGTVGEYRPTTVSWQATAKSSRMVYQLPAGSNKYRLIKEIAPAPQGITCSDQESTTTVGCRTLTFNYFSCTCWGNYRLGSISYFDPSGSGVGRTVAQYGYDSEYRLTEEWDPRISPALKETYGYETKSDPTSWTLASLTLPGQAPWQFSYYSPKEFQVEGSPPHYSTRDRELFDRLKSVSRASLLEATPTTTSTVVYQVPLSGSAAPYDMSPATVAAWGQSDYPLDATAVFPPDQIPTSPRPTDFSHATVSYLDAEGYEVNVAAPAPPGAEGASISTTETDTHGNVIRTLTPQNRLRALAAGSGSVARSKELDNHSVYSSDGTELLEAWGPLRQVRLGNGEVKEARLHSVIKYNEGAPTPPANTPQPHLPTKETTGAAVPGVSGDLDQRVTETRYNWSLLAPTETIVDPGTGNLNIKTVTVYDEATGLPIESRQPSNPAGGGAGSTKTIYYRPPVPPGQTQLGECEVKAYSGLPCKVMPAAQPGTTGMPQLLVKEFRAYNGYDEPMEIVESPGGGTSNVRKTILTYDAAGRQLSKKIEGGGTPIPKTEIEYSEQMGLPIAERFKCEAECGSPQFLTSMGYASPTRAALSKPADVAVDAGGNVWAVDKANNRIVQYNEAGEFLREAGSLGSTGGKLSSPSAIAIDSVGNLDVTDTANNRVAQFSSTGAFIAVVGTNVNKTKVEAGGTAVERNRCTAASGNVCQAGTGGSGEGEIAEPIGITTIGGQNFFVVERANNRVEKFNPQGELLGKFGGPGSENGQLKEPTGIAFQGFLLWVADTGNNRMEAFTTSHVYSRKFGTLGSANGELNKPVGVETDSNGNVWVADVGNNRVQKFSETGAYLLKFGSGGSEEGKFSFLVPTGLAIDAKGNLLVADPGNNRVQKWSGSGFDAQETKTTYDALGRATSYQDADGNKAEFSYGLDGRPVKTVDAKGSQVVRYDAASGLPVELEDSAAGVFTASYDADGSPVKRGLPNGLVAETTYDPTGKAIHLSYTKTSNCGTSCLWLDFGLEVSASGQILSESGTLGTDRYRYDKAGRLTSAEETPQGGTCTTRVYAYDADSNRTSLTTRNPGLGGACATSGGTTQSYEYDSADRLKGPTYDSWGRITSLPAIYAGGKSLTSSYFANDMVASQGQNGIINAFQLDSALRHRQRLQGGGLEGTEIFHYDDPTDSPAWTERGSTWTRNIVGIGGELVATQDSGAGVTLQLTNLHGDVSATAALSPEATSLKSTSSYDEFGNPTSGSAGRFGWLGAQQRRTELPSGVIQMGVRSYVPALGRFLTPDPVRGGSANPYDYANQDPVNNTDLTGECPEEVPDCYTKVRQHNRQSRQKARRHGLRRLANFRRGARASVSTIPGDAFNMVGALFGDVEDKAGKASAKAAKWTFNMIRDRAIEEFETRKEMVQYAWRAAKQAGGWAWEHRDQIVSCAKGAAEGWTATRELAPFPGGNFAIGLSMAVGCGANVASS